MKSLKTVFSIENAHPLYSQFGIDAQRIDNSVHKIVETLMSFDEIRNAASFIEFEYSILNFDIIFTNDDSIKDINAKYRCKDCPTDVITFALFADDNNKFVFDGEINLGEIIISLDTAKRQAESDINTEILTLITHGILHLFGFDHQTDEDYNFIVSIQNRVLEVL